MYESALSILKELSQLGYDSYIIGGYPRNLFLNRKTSDIDICTSATPDILKEKYEIVDDNSRFGSLRIKKDEYIFEITTFRIELEYHSRYPKIEYTNSILEDLKRRDFTINTLCIDENGQLLDFMNIKQDFDDRIIRCVGDINNKINEDPLRILRAIRFSSELDFKIEEQLLNKIINDGHLINTLSTNQINKELSKMNDKAIEQLKKLDLWRYIDAREDIRFN